MRTRRLMSDWLGEQSPQPDQVVGRRMKGKDPIDERTTAMMELAQQADGLHPPKRLLDQFPFPLTDLVPGMPSRARIDRAAPVRRLGILRHVRRQAHLARVADKVARAVVGITSDGDTSAIGKLAKNGVRRGCVSMSRLRVHFNYQTRDV